MNTFKPPPADGPVDRNFPLALALCLILWLAACGEDREDRSSTAPGEMAKEIPAVVPPPPEAALVTAETRSTYQWYCTQCHGVEGKGNGVNAPMLAVPPRDHTKANYLETRTDRQLFDTIQLGGLSVGRAPCMPAWGHTLDDQMIHSLVRYIRELCKCEAL